MLWHLASTRQTQAPAPMYAAAPEDNVLVLRDSLVALMWPDRVRGQYCRKDQISFPLIAQHSLLRY